MNNCPVLVEFDGSIKSLQIILHFVAHHKKLEKNADTPIACRVLQHYIDHFPDYNFSTIACIILSNVIGIINVNHLKTPHIIDPNVITQLEQPYKWDPDFRGMCIYINCDSLNINLFNKSKVHAFNNLVNYEARKTVICLALTVASSIAMVWIYKKYINIY